jgi:tRNA nucleotidyltransferase (CCA-adding enzyme)
VLRACQFAARFGLRVDERTVEICREIELSDLPKERIWGEWEKLLLKAARPSFGILAAQELGVLDKLFPYIGQALQRRDCALCAALDRAAAEKAGLDYEKQVTLMLAVLGCFLGRPYLEQLLDALGIYTLRRYDVRRQVIVLSGERNRVGQWFARRDEITDKEFRYLSARCEPRLLYRLAKSRGNVEAAQWFIERMETLGVADGPPAPLLMGRHLLDMGLQPGPQIGQLTQTVYAQQLAGEVTTLDEAIAAARVLITQPIET